MRVIIAGYPFDLTASEVELTMRGVRPEPVTGPSVRIGRSTYPVKQVGALVTRQDRRDFTANEVTRAMKRLGFTCQAAPEPPPVPPAAVVDDFAYPDTLPVVPPPAPREPSSPPPSPSPFAD
ncbi:SCO5918 family protein [Streptomyces sp. NPDC051776]|uniref:SCO5918 family protein n=1 Tax=Streptomyces sp. NPDC051776 TaxID=3155414 RepID=UPI0034386750